jgi:hypothetical protein
LERLQSEKPRIAKKAEENKLFAKPVPHDGSYMAAKKKEDESMSAKLGSEPADGVSNGVYSEFLHQWCENLTAIYPVTVFDNGCRPAFNVGYRNGHVTDIQPADSCAVQVEGAFRAAMNAAEKPPMPTSLGNQDITFVFLLPNAKQ